MGSGMIITFVILTVTILLFVFSKLRPDLVAVISLLALFLAGVITPKQALAGFSDTTVILVAALFVVGEGLSRTGITHWLGQQLMRQAGDSQTRLLIVLMVGTGLISAFLSNTGTVAMLLPAAVAAAWRLKSIPSRFLIPMAFAASLGGLLTLIGSPTNIVVSDTLSAAGMAPFSFFSFALIGAPLLVASVVLLVFLAPRLLPDRSTGRPPVEAAAAVEQMAESYSLQSRLFVLEVGPEIGASGRSLEDIGLGERYSVSVLRVERAAPESKATGIARLRELQHNLRDEEHLDLPNAATIVQPGDLLIVKGRPERVQQVAADLGLGIQELTGDDETLVNVLVSQEVGVAEVLIAPRSDYAGRRLAESDIAQKFGVQVLSLLRGSNLVSRQDTRLALGDSLLVRGPWSGIDRMREDGDNFVVVGEPEAMARQVSHFGMQTLIAAVALIGMIFLMVTSIVPPVMAALLAAVVMVLGGAVTPEGAYRSINWTTVVLIAAMLPMSTAMEVTGGAAFIANTLVGSLGTIGPLAVLAGVFVLTAGLSQVMSNTATTVLLAPIVLETAGLLGVSPYPMLMMVAVGAAAAFLTPIASPTNMLVYAPGGYVFGDYAKIGLPLLILVFIVSMLLVPFIWPF
ncbi:MAG: SLC13 family permease [Anaerolineae bacterium]